MSTPLSPHAQDLKAFPYMNFDGMDTSVPSTSLENGENQALVLMNNCYADWRGIINLDKPLIKEDLKRQRNVVHIAQSAADIYTYVHRGKLTTSLFSNRNHEADSPFKKNAVIASTVFNGLAIFCSVGEDPIQYDGFSYRKLSGTHKQPAYATTIQRRLILAGMPSAPTSVWASRVDKSDVFPLDEQESDVSVLKGATLDIRNLIGTGDVIKGIQAVDASRLAIFTNDKAFVYVTSPNYLEWVLDGNATINFGTLSHNSIVRANGDLIFCSRSGVHALRRSAQNGIVTLALPMSEKVKTTYMKLVRMVANPEDISAVFDQDNGQYSVFFPIGTGQSIRLTATIPPLEEGSEGTAVKWSVADFYSPQCGSFLNGKMLYGTPTGVFRQVYEDFPEGLTPDLTVETPIFWMGDGMVQKELSSITIQAEGRGDLDVVARDEIGRELGQITLALDDEVVDGIFEMPVLRQQHRKFEFRVRGLQLRFASRSQGHIKLVAFSLNVRKK